MKQSFMLILMAVCGFVGNAAAHEYMPLVEEGKTWHYKMPYDTAGTAMCNEGATECTLTMRGDTVIDGLTYKKIFFADRKAPNMAWPVAYMREENKVVTAKSNTEAVNWLRNTNRTCHDYREFMFVENLIYDFNDYSSPNLADSIFRFPESPTMERTVDNRDGFSRPAAYWRSDNPPYIGKDCTEVWVTEGIGLDGATTTGVQLLRLNQNVVGWHGMTTIFGFLQYVTNADGEVIYKGRFAKSEPSVVHDVVTRAEVVSEEYYSVNGVRLTAPMGGICIKVTRFSDGSTQATKEIR